MGNSLCSISCELYISGIPKAYLASLGVTEEVSKDIKVEFESVTLSKCSIGSSASCSWIYGDSVESSAPKLNDIKHGLFIWSFSGGGMVVDKPNFIPKEPKASVTEVIRVVTLELTSIL